MQTLTCHFTISLEHKSTANELKTYQISQVYIQVAYCKKTTSHTTHSLVWFSHVILIFTNLNNCFLFTSYFSFTQNFFPFNLYPHCLLPICLTWLQFNTVVSREIGQGGSALASVSMATTKTQERCESIYTAHALGLKPHRALRKRKGTLVNTVSTYQLLCSQLSLQDIKHPPIPLNVTTIPSLYKLNNNSLFTVANAQVFLYSIFYIFFYYSIFFFVNL